MSEMINDMSKVKMKHPLQDEINGWSRKQYFMKWFFEGEALESKKKNIKHKLFRF